VARFRGPQTRGRFCPPYGETAACLNRLASRVSRLACRLSHLNMSFDSVTLDKGVPPRPGHIRERRGRRAGGVPGGYIEDADAESDKRDAWGLAPGKAIGALLSGPRRIQGGLTTSYREYEEEGQHVRRPAQGQPRGASPMGRCSLFRLVGRAPPCLPRRASRSIPRCGRRARDLLGGQTPSPGGAPSGRSTPPLPTPSVESRAPSVRCVRARGR
jgi:hypothetical protein